MLKKILIAVGCVLLVAAGCITTFLVTNHFHQQETETLTAQMATLQARLDDIGPIVECYTVRTVVEPGQQLTEDLLVAQNIPMSFVNDDFCSKADILGTAAVTDGENVYPASGYFAKTYIEPGTPITKSLLMAEKIIDSSREIDVIANRWPIGLKEGDYVDIRLTYPMGEDFIVMSHKRVYEVNDQTLKLHVTEEEFMMYQAALVDYYIGASNGMDIYFTKYIEPGVQAPAYTYYSVPENIARVCALDPNIINLAEVSVKENLINIQRPARDPFTEEQQAWPGFISAGRSELNSAVNAAYQQWQNEYEKNKDDLDSSNNGSLLSGGVN